MRYNGLWMKFFWFWIAIIIVNPGFVVEGRTIVLGPSESIQAAIDGADPGDIIEVSSGTYREKVNVDRPLILFGVDTGEGKPVVDAGGRGSAITLSGSGAVLEGFVVTNSGSKTDVDAGVRVTSERNVIRDNVVKENGGCGILFDSSSHNIVTHNEFSDNLCGAGLFNSSENVLFLNVFKDNGIDAVSSNSTNRWNSSDPIGYRYGGEAFTAILGNHWSEYSGPDGDGDGIGDLPHIFGAERDEAPLIMAGLQPEIAVDKAGNVTSGGPGTVVKFTIDVANVGEMEFDRVVVADVLPDGLEYLGDDRNGTVAGRKITWELGRLSVGESMRVELLARISGSALGNITNHAEAAGILSTEYSLTDEDTEALEALIERVILARGTEFSREVIYVVPPPSALSDEVGGNTFITIPLSAGGPPRSIEDMYAIRNVIARAQDGDTLEVRGFDPSSPYGQDPNQTEIDVNKSLYLRGVVMDASYGPPTFTGRFVTSAITVSGEGCIIEGLVAINSDRSEAGIKVLSNNNVIKDNIAKSNRGVGFFLNHSSGNVITRNTAEGNRRGAIRLESSSGNIIYLNNFINGSSPVGWSDSKNIWNSLAEMTYLYNGTTFTSRLGNYWSDYSGVDADGDGIGDTPYDIPGPGNEQDKYPLMETVDKYELSRGGSFFSKVADRKTARHGEEITYTISVCNSNSSVPVDAVVEDIFDRPVELVSVSPAPDGDGLWRFYKIGLGECRKIVLVAKAPKRQEFEFQMNSGVAGTGFVRVANDYSTAPPSYLLKNCATAVFYLNGFIVGRERGCAAVLIDDPGAELSTREHGSGLYKSDETITLRSDNRSIEMNKAVSADHGPSTLTLYRNRTLAYSSRWTEEAKAKNRATGASMAESYRYATTIDRESRFFLDRNESVMEVESQFDGMGQMGFLKMPSNGSGHRSTPIFEMREDYVGSFRVLQKVDEYGSSVRSEKAANGGGLFVGDRRIGSTQRSYEAGSGTYDSEEVIRTYTSYIAKDVSFVHAPTMTRLTDSASINSSMKVKEGISSKVPETTLIGEEYTSITRLDKETVARGLNEMETEASFSGQGRYRTVFEERVDLDELYAGDYSIRRKVLMEGVSKYDRPHINLTKSGVVRKETVVEEMAERRITVAEYTITLENDGNRALSPVRVKDLFPPGAAYRSSSLRPYRLTAGSAEWVLTHLAIGGRAEILLRLEVTDLCDQDLINRVEASGGYDGGWANATNFSAIERGRLWCCPAGGVSAALTAKPDGENPRRVVYNLTIRNEADAPRVVAATCQLPEGMRLLDSSVPFSSYDSGVVTWNLIDLLPFGSKTILFEVEASMNGTFASRAEVEVLSIDGTSSGERLTVEAVVTVGEFEGEMVAPGWRPPEWGLDSTACPGMGCWDECDLAAF